MMMRLTTVVVALALGGCGLGGGGATLDPPDTAPVTDVEGAPAVDTTAGDTTQDEPDTMDEPEAGPDGSVAEAEVAELEELLDSTEKLLDDTEQLLSEPLP
jgi:hypothetical protein